MTVRIWQKFDEQATLSLDQPDDDLVYMADGSESLGDILPVAYALLGAFGTGNYRGLWLQSIKPKHLGAGAWTLDVHYGKVRPVTVDSLQFTAETTGGTIHREVSLETVHYYTASGEDTGTAPDFQRLIGVTKDHIAGVDIPGPKFAFTVKKKHDTTALHPTYLNTLQDMTPSTNSNPIIIAWKGQVIGIDPGECLYHGGAISDGGRDPDSGNELIDIDHKFEVSRNDDGLVVGDIAGIRKAGWEYLWCLTRDTIDSGFRSKEIVAVYIEKVFFDSDFTQLQLY